MAHIKFRIVFIVVIFLTIISFPIINENLSLVKDIASTENRRRMVPKPTFDINLLDPYPEKFEKYYCDTFTLRSTLIKYFNLINLTVYKKSPIPNQVILGNDGWLFKAGDELDTYTGKNYLKQSELEALKKELEYRDAYIKQQGCIFYIAVASVKANIYSDKVPDTYFKTHEQSLGE